MPVGEGLRGIKCVHIVSVAVYPFPIVVLRGIKRIHKRSSQRIALARQGFQLVGTLN